MFGYTATHCETPCKYRILYRLIDCSLKDFNAFALVICEDAVIYPEIDAGKAALRRSQILDAMLQMNGKAPIFFRLNQEQQLCIGNELMKLILAHTGNFRDAVDFAEGKRLLTELGLLDEAIGLIDEKTAGIPFRQVIDATRSGKLLTAAAPEDDHEP